MNNGYYTDGDDCVYESPAQVLYVIVPESELLTYELEALTKLVEASWGEPVLSELTGLTWHESRCWTDGTKVWSTDHELKAHLWRRLMARDRMLCGVINEWMLRRNMTVLDGLFTNAVVVFEEWFDEAVGDEAYMKEWLGIERCGSANGFKDSMEG